MLKSALQFRVGMYRSSQLKLTMVTGIISACKWWMLMLLAVGTTVKSQGQGILYIGSYIAYYVASNFYLVPTYLAN